MQFGFRSGRTTADAVSFAKETIKQDMNMVKSLRRKYNVPQYLLRKVEDYVKDRHDDILMREIPDICYLDIAGIITGKDKAEIDKKHAVD